MLNSSFKYSSFNIPVFLFLSFSLMHIEAEIIRDEMIISLRVCFCRLLLNFTSAFHCLFTSLDIIWFRLWFYSHQNEGLLCRCVKHRNHFCGHSQKASSSAWAVDSSNRSARWCAILIMLTDRSLVLSGIESVPSSRAFRLGARVQFPLSLFCHFLKNWVNNRRHLIKNHLQKCVDVLLYIQTDENILFSKSFWF